MNRTTFDITLTALLLIPLQAIVFNHMVLFGVAITFAFIYVLLRMPVTLSVNWVMTAAFAIGLAVDIFSDTAGLNALCCTVLAFVRKPIFHLYMPSDDGLGGQCPSSRTMGSLAYIKYVITASLLYCLLFFTIEVLQLFNPMLWIMRIAASTIFTAIVVFAIDCLMASRRHRDK